MLALKSAAAQIRASHDRPDLAMVLNLGPTWVKSDAYSLFANNVIEITFKGEYETPPGLGVCPLSVIFEACTSISSWINMDEDNVVVRVDLSLDWKTRVAMIALEPSVYTQW